MILNETMNEIADAIREKTGKSEKIAPINFAEEIKSISAGGGESVIHEYYKVEFPDSAIGDNVIRAILTFPIAYINGVYKYRDDKHLLTPYTSMLVGGSTQFGELGFIPTKVEGIHLMYPKEEGLGLIDVLKALGGDETLLPDFGFTPCTKEEFEALITE